MRFALLLLLLSCAAPSGYRYGPPQPREAVYGPPRGPVRVYGPPPSQCPPVRR